MKHLVDLDEAALDKARSELGTTGIKDTVNTALAIVADSRIREDRLRRALDSLADIELTDAQRSDAWR
jgi:hypothetical protein